MMTLPETVVFVLTHPKTGLISQETEAFHTVLPALVVTRMAQKEQLTIADKRLHLQQSQTDDPLEQLLVTSLQKRRKAPKVKNFLQHMAQKNDHLLRIIRRNLAQKNYLYKKEKRFLGIIPYLRFPVKDTNLQQSYHQHYKDILQNHHAPNDDEKILLAYLSFTQYHQCLSKNRKERRMLKQNLKTYRNNEVVFEEAGKAIREIHAALIATVATTTAIIATNSSST